MKRGAPLGGFRHIRRRQNERLEHLSTRMSSPEITISIVVMKNKNSFLYGSAFKEKMNCCSCTNKVTWEKYPMIHTVGITIYCYTHCRSFLETGLGFSLVQSLEEKRAWDISKGEFYSKLAASACVLNLQEILKRVRNNLSSPQSTGKRIETQMT